MDKHSELERKFDASHISELQFQLWCSNHHAIHYETTTYPDHYFSRGTSVIRHRMSGGAGVLTVKQRKSVDNIEDRVEIDLTFGPTTTADDVTAFIVATGWEHELSLNKHFSHMAVFNHGGAKIALSLYEVEPAVGRGGRISRMFEIEIEKDSDIDEMGAARLLDLWCSILTDDFDLSTPMNLSLYELYSGKRYEVANKNISALEAAFAIR